jgi:hypothetical protein
MTSTYDPSPAYPERYPSLGRLPHTCADWCVCPVHGTPLIWWPAGQDHACQDVTCEYGHGGLRYPLLAALLKPRAPAVPGQAG